MDFLKKLPTPREVMLKYPLNKEYLKQKILRDKEIKNIFEGKSNKFILIIGPCSADRENVVLEEHDAYKWQTASEAMANPKITQEVKKCIEIYGFNEDMKSLSKKKINSIVANKQKTVEQVLTNR